MFPAAGRQRDLRAGLRSYVVHPFIVFHVVDHQARKVIIERVLHGASDVDRDEFVPN